MPTLTTVALDSLLESRLLDLCKKSLQPNLSTPGPAPETYAASFPSSSYVVKYKKRGGDDSPVTRRIGDFEIVEREERKREGDAGGDEGGLFKLKELATDFPVEFENEDEGFLDPQSESLSVGSCSEFNDFGKLADNQSVVSAQAEFYDADEDFSSDASVSTLPSFDRDIESELHNMRLSLLEETVRRESAEADLSLMYSKWQNLNISLSSAGLTFPATPNDCCDMQLETDTIEQFTQEVIVTKFVAEAIGKGQARAEAQLAAETILDLKDHEISRLRYRLHYYEAVNHEMSQRNLQIVDSARRERQRKKNQRRWLWSGVGITVGIAASVIAYSYSPQVGGLQPLLPRPPLPSGGSSDT